MPNKRFLGLGFTFSATDRGLEKKLLGVKKALSGIASSLDDVNAGAASASASFSRMKRPKLSASKSSASSQGKSRPLSLEKTQLKILSHTGRMITLMRRNPLTSVLPKEQKVAEAPREKTQASTHPASERLGSVFRERDLRNSFRWGDSNLKDVMSKLSDESKKTVTDISKSVEKVLGKDLLGAWKKQSEGIRIEMDSLGNMSDRSAQKLLDLANNLATVASESDEFAKNLSLLKTVFEMTKHWFADVKGAATQFLNTIGVDFSKMIPEQLKALYGVLDAALLKPLKSGLGALGKNLFGRVVKSRTEKYQEQLLKSIGTDQSKNSSVQALLAKMIKELEEKKEKPSIWSDLFSVLLAPLGLVAGALMGFVSPLAKVVSLFKDLKIVQATSGFFQTLISKMWEYSKTFKPVAKASEWLGEIFGRVGKIVGAVSERFGFIGNIMGKLGSFMGKVMEGVGKFGEMILSVGSKFKWVFENPIFAAVFKFGKFIGRIFGSVFLLYDVVTGIIKAFQEGTGAMDILLKSIWNIIDNISMGAAGWIKDKLFPSAKENPEKKNQPAQSTPIVDQRALGTPDPKNNVVDIKTKQTLMNRPIVPMAPQELPENLSSGGVKDPAFMDRQSQLRAITELNSTQKDSSAGIILLLQRQNDLAEQNNEFLSKMAANSIKKMEVKVTSDKAGENTSAQLKVKAAGG